MPDERTEQPAVDADAIEALTEEVEYWVCAARGAMAHLVEIERAIDHAGAAESRVRALARALATDLDRDGAGLTAASRELCAEVRRLRAALAAAEQARDAARGRRHTAAARRLRAALAAAEQARDAARGVEWTGRALRDALRAARAAGEAGR